ncbi:Type II secretion system (T2SS), protein F [Planctomicrobium piriforme]|uniref:Type II secretion system (T2SS), protein F n=2 Tax=Planctomicrobium piriforme TaxID=1576369 RepID=A0A1I3P5V5_9PLAN|nr:Type II secretion system (T2SS), protein F [Planctomicrobium piriforme]
MNIPQLTPQQITLLSIGLGVVFGVYILYKVVQWARHRSHAAKHAPKMRPKGYAPPVATQPAETMPVATAFHTEAVAPTSILKEEAPVTAAAVASEERSPASEASLRGSNRMTTFWPVEPKTFSKRNLFEDVGAEYPYATTDDYRFGGLTPVMAELLPSSEEGRRETTKTLRNAGYYEPHAWQNFSALRYLGVILPIIVFGALLVVSPEVFEPYLIAGLVIGPALGWALPALAVRSRAKERMRQIEGAMPDMLDLLNMCVSQGMTVPHALGRVSREFAPVYPVLSKELQIVTEQARVGNLSQALTNFSERVDVPEVHSFTSLLIQTEQMGTSVSEALTEYSDSMRESQRQRADEKANAATFKLLFPTVLCLMPAVFLLLMGPAMIELNKFFSNGGIEGLRNQSGQVIEQQR